MVTAKIENLIKRYEESKLPPQPAIPPSNILSAVASIFDITVEELKGKKRDEFTSLARHIAMYLIRQDTDFTLNQAGALLGNRTPATVSYAYTKIASLKGKRLKSVIKKIREIYQQKRGIE